MRNKYSKVCLVPTDADYAVGRHQQWECAAHEAAEEFFKKHGHDWTHVQRAVWIDKFLSEHNDYERNYVRACGVCSNVIADALLTGVNPFRIPDAVKAKLAMYGCRIRTNEVMLRQKSKEA